MPDVARIAAPAAAVLLALCVVTADPVLAAAGLRPLILCDRTLGLLAFGLRGRHVDGSVFAYPAFFIALGIGVDDVFVAMRHIGARHRVRGEAHTRRRQRQRNEGCAQLGAGTGGAHAVEEEEQEAATRRATTSTSRGSGRPRPPMVRDDGTGTASCSTGAGRASPARLASRASKRSLARARDEDDVASCGRRASDSKAGHLTEQPRVQRSSFNVRQQLVVTRLFSSGDAAADGSLGTATAADCLEPELRRALRLREGETDAIVRADEAATDSTAAAARQATVGHRGPRDAASRRGWSCAR